MAAGISRAAAVQRPAGLVAATEPRPAALVLEAGRRYALTVLNVGLACCAVEAMVASLGRGRPPGTVPYASADRSIDVFVVSGTVTDKLAPAVRRLYDALPGPVKVISFGACASSGGPYWDSYCVTRGIDLVLPVDAYVPGCPPRPQALLDALDGLDRPSPGPPPRPADLQRAVVRPPDVGGRADLRAGPA